MQFPSNIYFSVGGCSSFCFVSMYKLNNVKFFLQEQTIFSSTRQVFVRSQYGFLRSEENVNLSNFQHLGCMDGSVSFNFLWTLW